MPVHNAGEYLYQCLDTLVNQSLINIEIIVVLDCPSDGSDNVVKDYAIKDRRIKIIENTENLHIGNSRNRGIDAAVGKYIGFSDHDDYRDLFMYEELYEIATEKGSDVVISAFGSDTEGNVRNIFYPQIEPSYLRSFILSRLIGRDKNTPDEERFFCQNGAMWNKIYKADFLRKHSIRFVDTNKYTYEDLIFLIKVFVYAKNVELINKVYYYHRQDIQNTSSLYSYNEYQKIKAYLDEVYMFLQFNNFEKYQNRFYHSVIDSVHIAIKNEFKSGKSLIEKIKVFKFFKNGYTKQAFNSIRLNPVYSNKDILKNIIKLLIKIYYTR